MVGDTWVSNSVPTTYAVKTFQTAQQKLQQASDALTQASTIPALQRTTALEHLQNLQNITTEMLESVQRGDRSRVVQLVGQISAEEEAIKTLARSEDSKP